MSGRRPNMHDLREGERVIGNVVVGGAGALFAKILLSFVLFIAGIGMWSMAQTVMEAEARVAERPAEERADGLRHERARGLVLGSAACVGAGILLWGVLGSVRVQIPRTRASRAPSERAAT